MKVRNSFDAAGHCLKFAGEALPEIEQRRANVHEALWALVDQKSSLSGAFARMGAQHLPGFELNNHIRALTAKAGVAYEALAQAPNTVNQQAMNVVLDDLFDVIERYEQVLTQECAKQQVTAERSAESIIVTGPNNIDLG